MLTLELSLSGSLTTSDQGSLTTIGGLFNISTLDPLLPTFLIATLCLCALSVITYYSLALAWEVFWASQRSPLLLDLSAEVVLTIANPRFDSNMSKLLEPPQWGGSSSEGLCLNAQNTSQVRARE